MSQKHEICRITFKHANDYYFHRTFTSHFFASSSGEVVTLPSSSVKSGLGGNGAVTQLFNIKDFILIVICLKFDILSTVYVDIFILLTFHYLELGHL